MDKGIEHWVRQYAKLIKKVRTSSVHRFGLGDLGKVETNQKCGQRSLERSFILYHKWFKPKDIAHSATTPGSWLWNVDNDPWLLQWQAYGCYLVFILLHLLKSNWKLKNTDRQRLSIVHVMSCSHLDSGTPSVTTAMCLRHLFSWVGNICSWLRRFLQILRLHISAFKHFYTLQKHLQCWKSLRVTSITSTLMFSQ